MYDYDNIAKTYDSLVDQDVIQKGFPYAGYQVIKDLITDDLSSNKKRLKILDLGCGTGKLYEMILPQKYHLTGLDISKNMLNIAKERYPSSKFILHDILKGMPESLRNESYDYIIVNYVFMHFSFNTSMDLMHDLVKRLNKFGKIIISDIFFINQSSKHYYFEQHQDYAELNLNFHVYSQYVNQMSNQLALSYFEINEYTGMMIIENINEFTLLFEDPLVKYKSNTVKWKSTHPQRTRE